MNLNDALMKADDSMVGMASGVYSPLETENFLRGMIAVLLCSDEHGAAILAARLNRAVSNIKAAQGKAA